MKMSKLLPALLLLTLGVASILLAFKTTFAAPAAADIVALKTNESITIDGRANEGFWSRIPGVEIPLAASTAEGGKVTKLTVKAANNGTHIFLLTVWSDRTEDRVWHRPADYPTGPFEDRVAVLISIGAPAMTSPCMKFGTNGAVTAGEADLWHWHAARDDPDGMNFTYTSPPPADKWYAPWPVSDDQYANTTARYNDKAAGGRAEGRWDVRAKGEWVGAGIWTVEHARTLSAPDAKFDAALTTGTTVQVSFAVYDGGQAETEETKSISSWKTLEISSKYVYLEQETQDTSQTAQTANQTATDALSAAQAAQTAADEAKKAADFATTMGYASIGIAAVAIIVAIAVVLRKK